MATQLKKRPVLITVIAVVIIALIGYLVYSKMMAVPKGKQAGGPAMVKAMQVISVIHHLIMNMLVISKEPMK